MKMDLKSSKSGGREGTRMGGLPKRSASKMFNAGGLKREGTKMFAGGGVKREGTKMFSGGGGFSNSL